MHSNLIRPTRIDSMIRLIHQLSNCRVVGFARWLLLIVSVFDSSDRRALSVIGTRFYHPLQKAIATLFRRGKHFQPITSLTFSTLNNEL